VKVFLDTNVLASAFGTRGLRADVLRLILTEHELITGEVVLKELRGVLKRKFAIPDAVLEDIEALLRSYPVEPQPAKEPDLELKDAKDLLVVGSALNAGAEALVTGDHELLKLKRKPENLEILSPREFWTLISGKKTH
jgi:putative PIN family toxin of toxin-antitoxin system